MLTKRRTKRIPNRVTHVTIWCVGAKWIFYIWKYFVRQQNFFFFCFFYVKPTKKLPVGYWWWTVIHRINLYFCRKQIEIKKKLMINSLSQQALRAWDWFCLCCWFAKKNRMSHCSNCCSNNKKKLNNNNITYMCIIIFRFCG